MSRIAARRPEWRYRVRGRYPFPEDMLRRDDCRAADEASAEVLKLLLGDERPKTSTEDGFWELELVGSCNPTGERWRSCSWEVVTVPARDWTRSEPEPLLLSCQESLLASARAKLTDEEWEAVRRRAVRRHPRM